MNGYFVCACARDCVYLRVVMRASTSLLSELFKDSTRAGASRRTQHPAAAARFGHGSKRCEIRPLADFLTYCFDELALLLIHNTVVNVCGWLVAAECGLLLLQVTEARASSPQASKHHMQRLPLSSLSYRHYLLLPTDTQSAVLLPQTISVLHRAPR